jgi:hypothetical protein
MVNWFCYDSNGPKRGPYSGEQVKWLAKNGKLTPETIIETIDGKTIQAGKVKGLVFIETPLLPSKPTCNADNVIPLGF